MPAEPGIEILVLPTALLVGVLVALLAWHRIEWRPAGHALRVAVTAITGAVAYGTVFLVGIAEFPLRATRYPSLMDAGLATVLLFGGLAAGFAAGTGARLYGLAYLVLLGGAFAAGLMYVPFLVLCACFLGIGFLLTDQF